MAQSAVDCCNSALQRLGEPPIMSLSDGTRPARQCVIAFDSNRRAELRKHVWNFSIKRRILAADTDAPVFGAMSQFSLPADCLRVLLPNDPTLDWVLEGRKILSAQSSVNLRYVADIVDVSQWDAAFYDMVTISMASDMCEALTNSTGKKQTLDQEYKEAVASARKMNAFEQVPVDPPEDSFLLARFNGTGYPRVNFTT